MSVRRATVSFVDRHGEERVQAVRLDIDESSASWAATVVERFRFNVGSEPLTVCLGGRRALATPIWGPEGVERLQGATPFRRTTA